MQHVFIIGSRGLPAKYGGFETFVEKLVENRISPQIQYHVACLSDDEAYHHFDYKGVDCFTIRAPKLGPARVIAYDMIAINYALTLVKQQQIERPIFYILGNTIGAFIAPLLEKFTMLVVSFISILMDLSGNVPSGLSPFKSTSNILRK